MAIRKQLTALFVCFLAAVALGGLLPATAKAAESAPEELIVANVTVDVMQDGYWMTDPATGELTETQDSATCNVRYVADESALYLSDATIGKGTVSATGGTHSIYASGAAGVSLTIHLTGENHLSSSVPIYITSDSGKAELNIVGDGILNAEGTAVGNGGIFLRSGGTASGGGSYLNITDGADVVSNCSESTAVMFYARPGGEAILTVMDASLTANGWYPGGEPRGIFFSRLGSGDTANFYLRLANNAVVRANKVAILSGHTLKHQYNTASGGMYFNGDAGIVYGSVTLQENLSIGESETLTINQGASLTIPEGTSLINEGTVTGASGSIINNGTIYSGEGATLPSGITGSGTIKVIPTYGFKYPDELELQASLGGDNFSATGALSLADDPVLGEDGRIVVYATNKGGIELQNEDDPAYSIPLTVRTLNSSTSSDFELENETRVLAVLDGERLRSYELQAVAFEQDLKEVPNGTYSGKVTLYVGYTKDSTVQFGEVANVDLDTLEPYTVRVTLENNLGLGITSEPQAAEVNEGNPASFSIAAEGGTTKTYQWQVSTDGGKSWTDIDGATDATYTTPTTTMDMDGNQYRCVVKAGQATIESDPAILTVRHVHKLAPAWTSDANGHWYDCEGCNDKVDYAAHTPKIVDKQDTTCTEDGYTGDTVCSVCGHVIAQGEKVPASGHTFKNGVCSICGEKDAGYVTPLKPEQTQADHELADTGDAPIAGLLGMLACGSAALATGAVLRIRNR